jgi:hypothetical protein
VITPGITLPTVLSISLGQSPEVERPCVEVTDLDREGQGAKARVQPVIEIAQEWVKFAGLSHGVRVARQRARKAAPERFVPGSARIRPFGVPSKPAPCPSLSVAITASHCRRGR